MLNAGEASFRPPGMREILRIPLLLAGTLTRDDTYPWPLPKGRGKKVPSL
jgi:hypothetical protein